MKITVVTSLPTKWNMNISPRQSIYRLERVKIIHYCRLIASLVWVYCQCGTLNAQTTVYLTEYEGKWQSEFFVNDSIFLKAIDERVKRWQKEGYLLASLDSIYKSGDTLRAKFYKGTRYQFAKVDFSDIPTAILQKSGISNKPKIAYDHKAVNTMIDKVINTAANLGYPFASIKMDSLYVKYSKISIHLDFSSGPKIEFDSLKIEGIARTDYNFISKYLGVRYGDSYSEIKFKNIVNRLNELQFLEVTATPKVFFANNKAIINTKIKELKINSFDGLIGMLQNANDESITITGLINMELHNLFGTGKKLSVDWQQLKSLSQTINVGYDHPMFLGSDLLFNFTYNQLKEDTSFLNRDINIGFAIPINRLIFNTSYLRNSGRILNSQSIDLATSEVADFNNDLYKIGISYKKLTRNTYPNAGIRAGLSGLIGVKSILNNSNTSAGFFENTRNKSPISRVEAYVNVSQPLLKKLYLYNNTSINMVQGRSLFLNDMYRLGGINSIRGFNEFEFFASRYWLNNFELRYIVDNQSYFFVFYDQSLIQLKYAENNLSQRPAGTGIGIDLFTKSGIFRIVYAIGRSEAQKFNFSSAKIHFGFTSRF